MKTAVFAATLALAAVVASARLHQEPVELTAEQAGPNDLAKGAAGSGQFVPFGKHVPRVEGVTYFTSTGNQECAVCKKIAANAGQNGANFANLCSGLVPEYMDMCKAQQKVLQSCPEFVNDWCYQDLGGTQALRSPCPDHLKCHYCLGTNPLHCV